MFLKLKMYGITGKVLEIITDMYKEVKYNIKLIRMAIQNHLLHLFGFDRVVISARSFLIYIYQ